jgi:hypothetical protein
MPVRSDGEFEIDSESDAGDYLEQLFELPEHRAIDVLVDRAKGVNDEYREYFINRGTEILRDTYGII